jgi:hypothetical protein
MTRASSDGTPGSRVDAWVEPWVDDAPLPRHPRPVTVTACPDGPLLVRGDVEWRAADGTPLDPGRRTVALCRCGGSANRPWCDGTHKVNGFRSGD